VNFGNRSRRDLPDIYSKKMRPSLRKAGFILYRTVVCTSNCTLIMVVLTSVCRETQNLTIIF
jgi:hypothetical protein